MSKALKGFLDHVGVLLFGGHANLLIDNLAALEDEYGRDAHDSILSGDVWLGVHVYFVDLGLPLELAGKLLDGRTDRLARTAPLRPEVNEDGDVGL